MATKSIKLIGTSCIGPGINTVKFMLEVNPDFNNYYLNTNVARWLTENNINYKFNSRKGRIKFDNDDDAILFKLRWL